MEITDDGLNPNDPVDSVQLDPNTVSAATSNSKYAAIRPIDRNIVHRICSGQVIVTLATAIKELVENSIDASATSIDIQLVEFGSLEIKVIDNGVGVEESNFASLTKKHYTSKLSEFEDLTSIGTFGFRGEALSSLCALADLSVTTKSEQSKTAYHIEYDNNGKIVSQVPCARSNGTTVVLNNIFHSIPVRHREFLKNLRQNFYKMINVLYGYCLISKGVRINCTNQERKGEAAKLVLCVPPLESIKDRLISMFGNKQITSLMSLSAETIPDDIPEPILQEYGLSQSNFLNKSYILEGYISKPHSGRSSSDRQFLFINSRPFDSPKIIKIINEVYHSFSSRNQYPFVCLNIKTNQENVDVNVSPDKRSIYLQNEKVLYSTIKAYLLNLYTSTSSEFTMNRALDQSNEISFPLLPSSESQSSSSSKALSQESTSTSNSLSDSSPVRSNLFSSTHKSGQCDSGSGFSPQFSGTGNARSIFGRFRRGGNSSANIPDMPKGGPSKEDRTWYNTGSGKDLMRSRTAKQPKLFDFIASQKNSKIRKTELGTNATVTLDSDGDEIIEETTDLQLNSQQSDSSTSFTTCEYYFETKTEPMDVDADLESDNETNSQDKNVVHSSSPKSPPLSPIISFSQSSNLSSNPDNPESNNNLKSDNLGFHDSSATDSIVLYDDEIDEGCDDDKSNSNIFMLDSNLDVKVKFDLQELKERLLLKNQTKSSIVKLNEVDRARRFRAKLSACDNNTAEAELKKELKQEMFTQMEIIGQFNLGFIIAKHDADLFIIDQHASDEKYNFETLEKTLVLQNQKLIRPMSLQLPSISENILIDNLEVFRKNGFDFEIDENGTPTQRIKLIKIPYSKSYEFGREDIEELIFMLEDAPEKSFCRPTKIRTMLASRACRKSVMIGTSLAFKEMSQILNHMGSLDQPWNCPHGRPTIRHLFNLNLMPDI